jgi:purine-binding chemotaxis protein CheW
MTSRILSFKVAGQLCGIPVLDVHDVIRGGQRMTPVPRAAPAIIGILNLRGRIALAVSLRRYLELADDTSHLSNTLTTMSLVIENAGNLYCLAVDSVGDVLSLEGKAEPVPPVLDANWRKAVSGVWPCDGALLAQLDVRGIIDALCAVPDEQTPAGK